MEKKETEELSPQMAAHYKELQGKNQVVVWRPNLEIRHCDQASQGHLSP